jgi:hypothetical protein
MKRVMAMFSHQLRPGNRRFLLPAAILAAAVLAGCSSARAPASPATPGTPASAGVPASPDSAAPGNPAAILPAVPAVTTKAPTPPNASTWRLLPKAPAAIVKADRVVSVWTGSQMLIHGVTREFPAKAVTVSYTPATRTWRTLAPGPAANGQGNVSAIWTGNEMLVFGPAGFGAYNPVTRTWRPMQGHMLGAAGAARVWTGRQALFWGGGCCGEVLADGAAYTPATNTWRALPRAPLRARYADGVWTGTEMIIAGGESSEPTLRVFADAAAYNPVTRTWRELPSMPQPRSGATELWNGRDALYIGGTLAGAHAPTAGGVAFNPATGKWRQLPAMEFSRTAFAAVWTGHQVLVWGGVTGSLLDGKVPPHGVAYDPVANRWSAMPMAPLRGRIEPTVVWTGSQMIVWGGRIPGTPEYTPATDGAAYHPGR